MAVKTPDGITDRKLLQSVVLQGDTFGSIFASVQVDTIAKQCIESGHKYMYKGILPIGMLGLCDDTIGITEAGNDAIAMNAFINARSAMKSYQFSDTKCKSILVGQDPYKPSSVLYVDKWNMTFHEDKSTGDTYFNETYEGLVPIKNADTHIYLGHVISNSGDNSANIKERTRKALVNRRKIFSRLESIYLGEYYFECAIVLMLCMLRSSLLYSAETYYNLKEH